jgi:hypothetical protein
VDHVYAADSTYEEVPLSRVLARAAAGTSAAVPGFDQGANLDLTWTVTSASPGGTATIAGYAATPTAITVRGKGKHKETGQPIEIALTLELWMAKGVPGAAELRAFDTKYATAVGLAPGVIEESMASFGVPRTAARSSRPRGRRSPAPRCEPSCGFRCRAYPTCWRSSRIDGGAPSAVRRPRPTDRC